ncbi:hypothetical protein Cfor_02111, partial [Coptotermes formosanus]
MGDIERNGEAASGASHGPDRKESSEEPVQLRRKFFVPNAQRRTSNVESIMLEIEGESDFNFVMDWPSWKTMLLAMYLSDVDKFSSLLRDSTTNLDVTDEKGNTALHCAVLSACLFGGTDGDLYNYIDLLMSHEIKVNMPNKKGYTAIGLAVHHLHKTCVERILKHPSAHRLYLDYYPGDSEYTVREIIMQTYPDLKPHLPHPLTESLESSDSDKRLLAALQRDKYEDFLKYLDPTNPNPWYDEPYHSYLLEIACQMKNRKQFVELLLDSGANPNIKNRLTGMPLLHATARSGNFELLENFLEVKITDTSVKDNEDRTILHWLAGVSEREPGDKQRVENCLKLLLYLDYKLMFSIDDRDRSGNTALCTAVERGFQDRTMFLLSKGADVMALEQGSKILLSSSLPILEQILNHCLMSNMEHVTSKDYSLKFKYPRLLRSLSFHMPESQHLRDLLRHPVMSVFLTLRWQKIRWLFFYELVFYITFVLFLTAYILYSESSSTLKDGGDACNTTESFIFNVSCVLLYSIVCKTPVVNDTNFTFQPNESIVHFLWYSVLILLFLLTLREMHQLILRPLAYIMAPENWMTMLLIIATVVSFHGVLESTVIKRHFSAIALLLGWFQLLLLSGRLPVLSVQQQMLKTVSLTFVRLMAGNCLLLIAFALSFYILFKGSLEKDEAEMFANPFLSLLKTIVMFTGEFEASRLSFDTLPGTSHVIFLLFLFMVAIILLNLLNVAVNDAEVTRRNAETLSLVARVRLISRIEGLFNALPKYMKPCVELREETFVIFPNRPNKIGFTAVRSLLSVISKKRKPNKESESTVCEEKWDMFAEKLSALQLQQEKLEKKLDSQLEILARLDIRE